MGRLKSWQIAEFKNITGEKGNLRFTLVRRPNSDTPRQREVDAKRQKLRDADPEFDYYCGLVALTVAEGRIAEKQIDEEARQRLYVAFDEQESANVGSDIL